MPGRVRQRDTAAEHESEQRTRARLRDHDAERRKEEKQRRSNEEATKKHRCWTRGTPEADAAEAGL